MLIRGALFVGTKHLSGPQRRVVHVSIRRRNIEVADDHEFFVFGPLVGEPPTHAVEPAQLVLVLIGINSLTVNDVEIDHACVANGHGNRTALLIGEPRNARHHIGKFRQRILRENRHAVVRFLPVNGGAITERRKYFVREFLRFELQFL